MQLIYDENINYCVTNEFNYYLASHQGNEHVNIKSNKYSRYAYKRKNQWYNLSV